MRPTLEEGGRAAIGAALLDLPNVLKRIETLKMKDLMGVATDNVNFAFRLARLRPILEEEKNEEGVKQADEWLLMVGTINDALIKRTEELMSKEDD